ncbi:MAG: hypothetical protein GTO18_08090 [Anaerolineales bacterium]|nr:hypothetical protein [Anaerolineales bacterium]
MSRTRIFDANISEMSFENINMRKSQFSAIDFGGARFSSRNTGEDRPKEPAIFENVEFDDCVFVNCVFSGVLLRGCKLEGMTIDGIPIEEMMKAYRKINR